MDEARWTRPQEYDLKGQQSNTVTKVNLNAWRCQKKERLEFLKYLTKITNIEALDIDINCKILLLISS